ncbi:MAG: Folylpolyglutamate synthase [Elusimicrobia bacterium]|nr:Folylpolyglutamate synthase [Elusimicrobiota bacterium]
MNFDLGRMRQVMDRLGNPQKSFSSVHVAGTNGKGSVTAMITSILRETRLKVGMYTSPHLEKVYERFQINGRCIPPRTYEKLKHSLKKRFPHLTEFELFTTLAFCWFSREKVDVAVVEVGLGGRLDATNVMENVLVSVITNIDYDHTEWLGKTLGKIAYEKAGIIKKNVPVVTGTPGEAFSVIKSIASTLNAPLVHVSKNISASVPHLIGEHQKRNAALACSAAGIINQSFFRISVKQITQGLQKVCWPGRFERFLLGSGPSRQEIILDGAHNPAGCRVLVKTIQKEKLGPVTLFFGALRDKNISEMARILEPVVKQGYVCPVPSDRSAAPEAVSSLKNWGGKMIGIKNIKEAWRRLRAKKGSTPLLVAGSLYLVGEIRRGLK